MVSKAQMWPEGNRCHSLVLVIFPDFQVIVRCICKSIRGGTSMIPVAYQPASPEDILYKLISSPVQAIQKGTGPLKGLLLNQRLNLIQAWIYSEVLRLSIVSYDNQPGNGFLSEKNYGRSHPIVCKDSPALTSTFAPIPKWLFLALPALSPTVS